MTDTDKKDELLYELFHQCSRGVHTYGYCECGNASRGSNRCKECILRDLKSKSNPLEIMELLHSYNRLHMDTISVINHVFDVDGVKICRTNGVVFEM